MKSEVLECRHPSSRRSTSWCEGGTRRATCGQGLIICVAWGPWISMLSAWARLCLPLHCICKMMLTWMYPFSTPDQRRLHGLQWSSSLPRTRYMYDEEACEPPEQEFQSLSDVLQGKQNCGTSAVRDAEKRAFQQWQSSWGLIAFSWLVAMSTWSRNAPDIFLIMFWALIYYSIFLSIMYSVHYFPNSSSWWVCNIWHYSVILHPVVSYVHRR